MSKTKGHLLILNKADLLDEESRVHWNQYFTKAKVNHVFFSAKQEIDSMADVKEAEEGQEEVKEESSEDEED